MTKNTIRFLASCGLILTAAIWGFAFVIVKDSLNYIGPIWMMALRFTIAAAALALVYCKKLKVLNARYWLHGAVTGAMLWAAYTTQTIGCGWTTAGKNAFLTTVYVILVPLFSWPLYRKRPGLCVWISAVLALCGIGMLALRNENSSLGMNAGDALTLVCGIFYALHIIFTSHFNRTDNPIVLTVLQFVFSALFSWILAPLSDGAFPLAQLQNPRVLTSLFYLGIFSTLIAFVLQNLSLKYLESSLASLFMSLESVFGVLFSAIFLHEKMTPVMTAGCVLIFAAITIAEQFKKD